MCIRIPLMKYLSNSDYGIFADNDNEDLLYGYFFSKMLCLYKIKFAVLHLLNVMQGRFD